MKQSIKEDNSHTDLGVMAIGDEGLLQDDIIDHLEFLYGLYEAINDIPPTLLLMHPTDYERFVEHSGLDDDIDWFEKATIEVHAFIPPLNYYFA